VQEMRQARSLSGVLVIMVNHVKRKCLALDKRFALDKSVARGLDGFGAVEVGEHDGVDFT
jgi:hypothetical protein